MTKPLVIIAGPTASGKSAAAVALARRLNGEIVSADSMQIYRGMDIGSAKIREEERQGVPHHLIDIRDPKDAWNVCQFRQEAEKAVSDIVVRGRLPILCGGTGFYIQALLYGIDFTQEKGDAAFRDSLMQLAGEKDGAARLYEMLEKTDPEAARQIHPNNRKRIVRALEFYHENGQKISEHNAVQREKPAAYRSVYFVLSRDREELYRRIDLRVGQMLEDGLVAETKRLKEQGLTATDVSMQGLGYKQILAYLDGKCSLEEAASQIRLQTRHFAKRQLTWFRREQMRDPDLIWVDAGAFAGTDALAQAMEETVRQRLKL